MQILILETSAEKGCLVLAENGAPIASRSLQGGPDLSKTLAREVAALLAGKKPDLIAVGTGPGSYTGIRVGAALAKGLSFGWKIPLMGFCSLKAFGAPPVLVDARGGGFYALFGDQPELISPQDPRLQKLPTLSSPHPETIKKRLAIQANWVETAPDPFLLSELVYRQFLEEGTPPLLLNYLSSP